MFKPEIKQSAVVHHPKFGTGRIVARYGEDEKSKVIVRFQEEGEKKLSLEFADLEVDQPEVAEEPAGQSEES
jgi:hypothetical protein